MRYLVSLLLLLTFSACSLMGTTPLQTGPEPAPVTKPSLPTEVIPPTLPAETGFSAEQIRNAEYQLGLLEQVRIVKLTDGIFQEGKEADYIAVRMQDLIAAGDLNSDGKDEAAVLVAENYGGTGVFVFLAIYEIRDGKPTFLTSIAIDDRPMIEELSIKNAEIYLAAIIHNFEDPMCCPTLHTSRHYRLTDTSLLMTDFSTKTPTGADRIITISSPEKGDQVSGVVNVQGSITIAPFENNLVYRIYDAGGVEVVAGPVEVTAPDLGAPGTFDRVIDLTSFAGTTIRIVIQDVSAADGSLFAMDSVTLTVRK